MIFVHFSIKLWVFKNKFFIEQRRHSKNISDGEYMCDRISCLRSYFNNFSALLHNGLVISSSWKAWLEMKTWMDEWTIKTPNPKCRFFFKVDLLTGFAALCLTYFIDWRYIHSWLVFSTQLVNCCVKIKYAQYISFTYSLLSQQNENNFCFAMMQRMPKTANGLMQV